MKKQIIVEGMHEPIISKEVFLQVQELKMEGSGETARAVEKIQSFSGAEALSAEVVKALVKEVGITDREHMEIRWNFKDEVMEFICEE